MRSSRRFETYFNNLLVQQISTKPNFGSDEGKLAFCEHIQRKGFFLGGGGKKHVNDYGHTV